jgi:Ca2+-binding RTX toxin-like protein
MADPTKPPSDLDPKSPKVVDNFLTTVDPPSLGSFGDGPDVVTVDAAIGTWVRLSGGDGNDALTGGSGGGDLYGGGGDDVLRFADAPGGPSDAERERRHSRLEGGANNDILTGGVGDDILLGGDGNDSLDGGASEDGADSGNDVLFGQLGDDTLLGDADTATPAADVRAAGSVSAITDGDDYVEGNGGGDFIAGNAGRDDLVGGSSNLFGLVLPSQRPDGSDTIFGGSATDYARNAAGDASATGHAADSDFILGDNGNVLRPVAQPGGGFLRFNYDNSSATPGLLPRVVQFLGYTPDGVDNEAAGGADLIRGEAGDDTVFGETGNDALFGDGQNDDLVGGSGNDWVSGGTGDDGILGDDGFLVTTRNGTAEPLYGITVANAAATVSVPGPVS